MSKLKVTILLLILGASFHVVAQEPIVIIASGQSNVLGRIDDSPYVYNKDVYIYNNDTNSFEMADFQNKRYRTVTGDYFGGGKANTVIAFANRIQHEVRVPVYVIIEGRGGKRIENWVTGNYTDILNRVVDQALASTPTLSRNNIEYFIWLQGEADLRSGMGENEYRDSFNHVMNHVEAPVKITAPISQAYIDNNVTHNNIGVQTFFHSLAWPYIVADVTGLTLGDNAHYDGRSAWELGYHRIYEALTP